jgi:uncharacterized protein (DUF58 family)
MEENQSGKPIKKRSKKPRARKGKLSVSTALTKIYKKAAQIADLMTNEDVEEDLRVLRQAKNATHHVYDTKLKTLVKVPDHKTRLAATTLSRAYHEGKPIERSMSATGTFEDLVELQKRVEQSQAFKQLTESSQKPVEG